MARWTSNGPGVHLELSDGQMIETTREDVEVQGVATQHLRDV